jgi:hypothetical protein
MVSVAKLPSSQTTTIALAAVSQTLDDVIAFTVLPTNASLVATSQLSSTSPNLPESRHHGGEPCMSWHSSGTMYDRLGTLPLTRSAASWE